MYYGYTGGKADQINYSPDLRERSHTYSPWVCIPAQCLLLERRASFKSYSISLDMVQRLAINYYRLQCVF